MRDAFLTRQLVNLGLVANATRPLPGAPAAIPAFFSGWLAGELAPQLLALTAMDAAQEVLRHGKAAKRARSRRGLAVALLAGAGYASLIKTAHRARDEVEAALREALGENYSAELERVPEQSELDTPWRALVNPFSMAHPDVVVHRRIPYAPGGRRFELDVFTHRDAPADAPVLLQVHGGGWTIGEKEQQGIPLMMRMAARGWVCVAINYPLSPKSRWPEHLIGVKRAVAWIREHIAEYGGDPSFLAVTGGSAGGHLAAMLALSSDDPSLQPGFEDADTSVQACAPHYGVYDFTDEDGTRASKLRMERLLKRYVMAPDATYPDDYRAASPLARVNRSAPPFFVLHGEFDTLVPVADARAFVAALRAVSKNPVAYAEISGAQHAFEIFPSVRSAHTVRAVERFLDWSYSDWRRRNNVSPGEVPAGVQQQH